MPIARTFGLFAMLLVYPSSAQQIIGKASQPQKNVPPDQAVVVGTGLISGTVVNAQSQEPVKKSHVILNGAANLTAITDSSGSFTFRALPAGAFFLNANQEDYYASPLLTNTTQITLKDAEEKHDVQIRLIPGGTVSGHVLDDDGEPVARCMVNALAAEQQMGRPTLVSHSQTNTDADGAYHLHGLQQGHYQIRVRCTESFPAPHGFMKRNDPRTPREGYPPVLYNSGGDAAQTAASGLRVASGQDLSGIDFHVKRAPLYTLQVALAGSFNQQPNITVISRDQGDDGQPFPLTRGGSRGANSDDGAYTFSYLPAGSYTVNAMTFGRGPDGKDSGAEAHQDVEVGKTPITSITLTLTPALKLTGSVEWDDPAQAAGNIQLSFFPRTTTFRGPVPQGEIAQDGTVTMNAISGHYRLLWTAPGFVKQFTVGGQPVNPEDFELGSAADFHILIGTKTGKLAVETGTQPAPGQIISGLLIPENLDLQAFPSNIGMADRSTGRITFPNVVPGKYKLVVIPTQNPWIMINMPDLLKLLAARGSAVDAAEGSDLQTTVSPMSADELQKLIEAQQ